MDWYHIPLPLAPHLLIPYCNTFSSPPKPLNQPLLCQASSQALLGAVVSPGLCQANSWPLQRPQELGSCHQTQADPHAALTRAPYQTSDSEAGFHKPCGNTVWDLCLSILAGSKQQRSLEEERDRRTDKDKNRLLRPGFFWKLSWKYVLK